MKVAETKQHTQCLTVSTLSSNVELRRTSSRGALVTDGLGEVFFFFGTRSSAGVSSEGFFTLYDPFLPGLGFRLGLHATPLLSASPSMRLTDEAQTC